MSNAAALFQNAPPALWCLNTTRTALSRSAEDTRSLIESGELLHAFNIGHGPKERCMRIWSRCVKARLQSQPQPEAAVNAVITDLFGRNRQKFPVGEVAMRFVCDAGLIHDLLRCGELAGVKTGNTQFVSRQSLAEFLTRRKA